MYPTSFLCPNGTLFQQQIFNCDWWYNVDCDAAEGLYGLAEGAFGVEANAPDADGQSGGSCPVVDPLSDAECAGAVSTCWSPGQPDTDCPDFGICCFDGCANTCEGEVAADSRPVEQTTPAYVPQPTQPPATTAAGYNYPVPDVTLPIRPVTTPAPVEITTPATLYGAPPPVRSGRRRNGRRRNGRRRGRRVKVLRKRI